MSQKCKKVENVNRSQNKPKIVTKIGIIGDEWTHFYTKSHAVAAYF